MKKTTDGPKRIVPRKKPTRMNRNAPRVPGSGGRSTADLDAESEARVTERAARRRPPPPEENDEPPETLVRRGRGPARTPKLGSPEYREMLDETEHSPPTPTHPDGTVLVFRRPDTGRPVAVPDEVVLAAERPYRAYCARLTGMSWEAVALEEGYPSPRAAATEVNRYLEEGKELIAQASAGALISLELARMDALQAAVWPKAMAGNLAAIGISMNVIMNRVKIMGLEVLAEKGEGAGSPRTVVVPMDDEGYLTALQEG